MDLYLLRHGIAEDAAPGQPDADRALTEEGLAKTRTAAQGFAAALPAPNHILSSPKVRAWQTAELFAEALGLSVHEAAVLGDGGPRDVVAELGKAVLPERVMLVGHEPTLSALVELICFGRIVGAVEMKKAGLAMLEVPPDLRRGQLRGLLPPTVLRTLGS